MILKAKTENWNQGNAGINIMGFFVEPHISGTIESTGELQIILPQNFLEVSKSAFAKANSQEGAAYEMILPTAQETFQNTEGLEFKGADIPLALAGKYYGFEVLKNDTPVSAVFPTSSALFMEHVKSPEAYPAITGWFYYFIYAPEAVDLEGTNTFTSLFSNDNDETYESHWSYDVHLRSGWNIIKHEVTEISGSNDGKYKSGSRVIIETVESLPSPMSWVSLPPMNLAL